MQQTTSRHAHSPPSSPDKQPLGSHGRAINLPPNQAMRATLSPQKHVRHHQFLILILAGMVVILSTILFTTTATNRIDMNPILTRLDRLEIVAKQPIRIPALPSSERPGRLIFYNRPPKTGSTTVRISMKKAIDAAGLRAAKCFNMIEWNEMALKTIVNRRSVDFYGCHTRLTTNRFNQISAMRNGNVTFITNTRNPKNIILSAYLQANRDRDIASITDDNQIAAEVEKYKKHVEEYPVDALYNYHGADVPLTQCPAEFIHIAAMRRIAERYEVVIDLERPEESAVMVEIVTGLQPSFLDHYNERTTDSSGKMLSTLKNVDTSHKECGNQLVHDILVLQFNLIKDRLMQNRCFNEEHGSFQLCNHAILKKESVVERTREESYRELARLEKTKEE